MKYFTIAGPPKSLQRHRMTWRGSKPRGYDPSAKDKKDFIMLTKKYAPKTPLTGTLYLKIRFCMPYAKKWYRTGKYAGSLKDNSPYEHIFTPDIDNLLKFVMDAGNGVLWKDDCIIYGCQIEKVYNVEPQIIIEVLEKGKDVMPDIQFKGGE